MYLPSLLRNPARLLFLASTLLLSGCGLNFWEMNGRQSTIVTDGPVAQAQLHVFYVTCWVTLFIFIVVGSVLAYATLKFRARSDEDEHAEPPPQSHGNPMVEISLIGASVLALVIIAIPTLKGIWYSYDVPADEAANAYEITAEGHQWWFKFTYPEKNSMGTDLVTGNELVIPVGRPIRVHLTTVDVIHSFWVPKLAGKVDMIPNRGDHLWLEADEPGYFWGQCAEYCGDSHALMRFRVVALNEADFNAWLASQEAPARDVAVPDGATPGPRPVLATYKQNQFGFSAKWAADSTTDPLDAWREQQQPNANEDPALVAEGKQLFTAKTCIACHTIRGHGAFGTLGPDLTHVGSRTTIAAGVLENTPAELARWISNPNLVKPGNKMWENGYQTMGIKISSDEAVALAAYLSSLK